MTTRIDVYNKETLSTFRVHSQKRIKSSTGSRRLNFTDFHKTRDYIDDIMRVEEKLDAQEIALYNTQRSSPSDPHKDLEIYKDYLQAISYYAKLRIPVLGACVLRGLQGLSLIHI